jgi:hypothetical protein
MPLITFVSLVGSKRLYFDELDGFGYLVDNATPPSGVFHHKVSDFFYSHIFFRISLSIIIIV